jgi:hypothetical protein
VPDEHTYDRCGSGKTAVCNSITTTWTHNDADQPLTESQAGGTLAALSMTGCRTKKSQILEVVSFVGLSSLFSGIVV